MRVNNNISAMSATRNFEKHQGKAAVSVARLSSGKKLNCAADDPAGMAISQKFKMRLRELGVIVRATETERDKADAGSANLMLRQDMLSRLREIAVQASSDTLTEDEKGMLMTEYSELIKEFTGSTFQGTGMEIVVGTTGEYTGELMYKSGDRVYVNGGWMEMSEIFPQDEEPILRLYKDEAEDDDSLKAALTQAQPETFTPVMPSVPTGGNDGTMSLIDYVDSLIKQNLSSLSGLGAASSSLTKRLEGLLNEEENALAALSRIEDADIAKEMMDFIKESMLSQSAIFAAAQANAHPKRVLDLLEAI